MEILLVIAVVLVICSIVLTVFPPTTPVDVVTVEHDNLEITAQNEEDVFDEDQVDKYVDSRRRAYEEFRGTGDDIFEDTSHIELSESEIGCTPGLAEDPRNPWTPTQPSQETQEFTSPSFDPSSGCNDTDDDC
jgi:hypothetical protein